jgi:hypothetical protein
MDVILLPNNVRDVNTCTMKSVVFWVITRRRVVNNYHTTPRNNPEDHRFHQHRGGSLKSNLYRV